MPPLAKEAPVPEQLQLMERVVERSNIQRAYGRVKQNKAGACHMNQALPRRYFDQFGLMCMLQKLQRFGPVLI
jgi:hypothetical protein